MAFVRHFFYDLLIGVVHLMSAFLLKLVLTGSVLLLAGSNPAFVDSRVYRDEPMPPEIEWGTVPVPEEMTVTTSDGLALHGYRWPARCDRHVALVFFHGNSGNRLTAAQLAAPLRRDDVDLIVASYRGYGDNPGKPDEPGLYRDADAFLAAAKTGKPEKLYVFGFSLGGAVAIEAASRSGVDGIATLGAFISLRDAAPPIARPFVKKQYDNLAKAPALTFPWLILHGTHDEVIPLNHGENLAKAAGERALLVRLKGAPHSIALDQIADKVWSRLGMATLRGPMEIGDATGSADEGNYLSQPARCREF